MRFLLFAFVLAKSLLFAGPEISFPMELHGVPFADKQGIVLSTKNVLIRDIEAPYNAALIKDEKGNYLLFFRYDIKKKGIFKHNYIACVALDENLDQKTDFIKIDTKSDFSNDPRALKIGSKFFLIFNDTISEDSKDRVMKIAELNMSNYQLNNITDLDRKIKKTEKNWIPFSYRKESKEEIHFIYRIDPYDVLLLENPYENRLKDLTAHSEMKGFSWSWGIPRGGTPAVLVDGEYLTFFHSSFKDRYGKRWYMMGAFTFEAHPPFKITAVSPCPILFHGIYDSINLNGASSKLRCIFPSGLVLSEDNSRVFVSCGENDSSVKIITFDTKTLLKSLNRLDLSVN
jgi:predicted GH43/DUF377 family glycosyl hydrolase